MTAKTCVLGYKPLRRYSADALAVLTARRIKEFQAHAERNPMWLVAPTLRTFELALRTTLGKRTTARKPETMRRYDKEVFYATVNRDAFRAVLLDTEPAVRVLTRTKRKPGVAQALARTRLLLKYEERKLAAAVLVYEETTAALRIADTRRAQTMVEATNYARHVEYARAMARVQRGPSARVSKGTNERMYVLRGTVMQARRAYVAAARAAAAAKRELARVRARIETLRQRSKEMENY